MNHDILYRTPLYLIFIISFLILAVAIEVSYRKGQAQRRNAEVDSLLELIPTSLLGLLALLLSFTFSMSLSRFDNRKMVLVKEANSIETTWLRAALLPPQETAAVRSILTDYLDHRIHFPSVAMSDAEIQAYQAKNEALQMSLWKFAQNESLREKTATSALFTTSANELIDLSTERQFAAQDHVPPVAYIVIFIIAIASLYSLAFVYGYHKFKRTSPLLLAFLLCVVLALIQDIDRPSRGIVRVDSSLMISLQESLKHR